MQIHRPYAKSGYAQRTRPFHSAYLKNTLKNRYPVLQILFLRKNFQFFGDRMNGKLVKQWVKKNGKKPEWLATRLKISISTVNKIFAGRNDIQYPTIIALSHIMKVRESRLAKSQKRA